jgi:thioredoxin
MKNITDIDLLKHLAPEGALFILFGGESCSVCKSIRPQLQAMLEKNFPEMHSAYVDCGASPEICAQYGVFSLPVIKAYIDGMMAAEEVGAFSIKQLIPTLERPYTMWKASES